MSSSWQQNSLVSNPARGRSRWCLRADVGFGVVMIKIHLICHQLIFVKYQCTCFSSGP